MTQVSTNYQVLDHLNKIWRAIIPLVRVLNVSDTDRWEVASPFWPRIQRYSFWGQRGLETLTVIYSSHHFSVSRSSKDWDTWNDFLESIASQLQTWGWTEDKQEQRGHLGRRMVELVRGNLDKGRRVVTFPDSPEIKEAVLDYKTVTVNFGVPIPWSFKADFTSEGLQSVSVYNHSPDLNAILDALRIVADAFS